MSGSGRLRYRTRVDPKARIATAAAGAQELTVDAWGISTAGPRRGLLKRMAPHTGIGIAIILSAMAKLLLDPQCNAS
jgi:hypothetical protein